MENYNHMEDEEKRIKYELLAIDVFMYGTVLYSFLLGLFFGYLFFSS